MPSPARAVRLLALVTGVLLGVVLLTGCDGPAAVPAAADRTSAAPARSRPFPRAADMDAYLSGLAAAGRMSGTVLVSRGPERFLAAYGLADRAAGTPDTAATMYRLGSVTKQFTAMAVLILQRQHRLSVSDRVCSYLPSCPPAWRSISIEELLTHTSGIPDYLNELGLPWPPRDVDPPGLIAEFRDAPLTAPPGTRMRYSNSGYALLGYLVERMTHRSYADALRQLIFGPLGMAHTGVDTTALRPGHARGYYADGSSPDAYPMSAFYAAGALYSTVEDMQRWDDALDDDRLLPEADMADALRPHVPCPPAGSPGGCLLPTDLGYGYGWFVARLPQGTVDYHVGHIDGYLSVNADVRAGGLHVVVLSNSESTDVLAIARELAGMA